MACALALGQHSPKRRYLQAEQQIDKSTGRSAESFRSNIGIRHETRVFIQSPGEDFGCIVGETTTEDQENYSEDPASL